MHMNSGMVIGQREGHERVVRVAGRGSSDIPVAARQWEVAVAQVEPGEAGEGEEEVGLAW